MQAPQKPTYPFVPAAKSQKIATLVLPACFTLHKLPLREKPAKQLNRDNSIGDARYQVANQKC